MTKRFKLFKYNVLYNELSDPLTLPL
uniref:Uncharacterized protein n=1 Tax=Anguilla anguilla TaxID=7936 RepID=A0A0E9UFM0_ANGAN